MPHEGILTVLVYLWLQQFDYKKHIFYIQFHHWRLIYHCHPKNVEKKERYLKKNDKTFIKMT